MAIDFDLQNEIHGLLRERDALHEERTKVEVEHALRIQRITNDLAKNANNLYALAKTEEEG